MEVVNLSEKEQLVFQSVASGLITAEAISEKTELNIKSVHPLITGLVKKGLVVKDEQGVKPLELPVPDLNTNQENLIEQSASIAVVIPYLKTEAAADELKFALRSFEKNFKAEFRVIVVGDQEDWFSDQVNHLPLEPKLIKEVCYCPSPSLIRNPQADVSHKILAAIVAESIEGDFILSNDDIILLGETSLADLASLKAAGQLKDVAKKSGLYSENALLTAKVLEKKGLPTVRYGTHTPMILHAEKLVEVIEKYDATEHGYLLTSLYYNEVYPNARPVQVSGGAGDAILASVYRADVPVEVIDTAIKTRKFLNFDSKGWPAVAPFLNSLFPDKSKFER